MAIDPVSAGVAGIGLLQQGKANKSAGRAAAKAEAKQGAVLDRIMKLFDIQLGNAEGAKASGLFDPEKNIALADEALNRNESSARTTQASTNRILGYRPGDSEPQVGDRKLSEGFNLKRRMQDFDIRQGSFANMMNAFGSISPAGPASAGQMYGGLAKNYRDQQTNPADMLGAFMKFYQSSNASGTQVSDPRFIGTRPGQFYS